MKKCQAQIINPQEELKNGKTSPSKNEYKSAGGVFMTLLKKEIQKDMIKKIFKVEEAK